MKPTHATMTRMKMSEKKNLMRYVLSVVAEVGD
jgi:hypothetical protein